MPAHDNDNTDTRRLAPLHLFEISFARWRLPVTVIAADRKAALDMAIKHQGGMPDARSATVWDASNAWSGLCQIRQRHTDQALAAGIVGIAHYDDEEGWRVTPVSPG